MENFLSAGEATHIVERAKPHMAKSGVALKDADRGKAAKESPTFFSHLLEPFPSLISRRSRTHRQGRQGVPHLVAVLSADDR